MGERCVIIEVLEVKVSRTMYIMSVQQPLLGLRTTTEKKQASIGLRRED